MELTFEQRGIHHTKKTCGTLKRYDNKGTTQEKTCHCNNCLVKFALFIFKGLLWEGSDNKAVL